MMVLAFVGALAVWQLLPRGQDEPPIELTDPAPSQSSAGTDSSSTTAPAEFTYRVGVLSGVSTDNFWAFYGGEASVWNAYILGPTKPALYSLDASTGTLETEVAVADADPSEEEGTWSVSLEINDSMTWSDGVPITAYDFVYTFDTVREAGLGGSWATAFPDAVAAVEATTPFEIRIEFTEQPTLSVWPHGPGLAPIMPAHVWEDDTTGLEQADIYSLSGIGDVGGGPLAIDEITEASISSVANPGYPFGDPPDHVVYVVYETEEAAVAALGAGDVDSILSPHGLTTNNSQLAASYPAVTVDLSPSNGIRYLGFNLTREPMSDQAFRQALALLLDRDALAGSIPGLANPAYSFVSPANAVWYDDNAARKIRDSYEGTLEDRMKRAVADLEDAGYTWSKKPGVNADGTVRTGQTLRIRGDEPTPLTILTPGDVYDPHRAEYAAQVAQALNWLGFDVRPVETDFDSVIDLAFTPGEDGSWQYDMYILGWTLGSPALPAYYRELFAEDGTQNNTGYSSDEFAKELDRYESAYNYEKAKNSLWKMEAILASDLPYLILYTSPISEAYRSDRVAFATIGNLGGLQGRLGGITDVTPIG